MGLKGESLSISQNLEELVGIRGILVADPPRKRQGEVSWLPVPRETCLTGSRQTPTLPSDGRPCPSQDL